MASWMMAMMTPGLKRKSKRRPTYTTISAMA